MKAVLCPRTSIIKLQWAYALFTLEQDRQRGSKGDLSLVAMLRRHHD